MAYKAIFRTLSKFFSRHSRKILLTTNIIGGITTAGLAVEAGYKSHETVNRMKAEAGDKANDIPKIEFVKKCAPHFIPTAISLGITTASGIASGVIAGKEIAASSAMAATADIALNELREGLKEKLGPKKADLIEADIHQDTVRNNPPTNIIETGYGDSICYDSYTNRYFYTSVERIRKVQNDMNNRIIREMCVTFNEVYAELGLPQIKFGDFYYWNPDHLIEFKISTCMDEHDRPVIWLGHYSRPVDSSGKQIPLD